MAPPRPVPMLLALLLLSASSPLASSFAPSSPTALRLSPLSASADSRDVDVTNSNSDEATSRRAFLSTSVACSAAILAPSLASADEEPEEKSSAFESIAARAAKVSQEVVVQETEEEMKAEAATEAVEARRAQVKKDLADDTRTIYDFTLPVQGKEVSIGELIGQMELEASTEGGDGGEVKQGGGQRVKAILVVNIKQDDPIARRNIPELMALANKYGKNGEFAVICSPTDQGYYEPDTSALLRLKLASEYGYGINPSTVLSDKVNMLGTGCVPMWRWLEGSCRTPAGLGKIQANFEKFLIDGRTGKPIRRYPRKYQPYDIADDVAAIVAGRPLPPARANWREEWRNAAKEAEADTYRFQKGLNYFDQ